MSKKRFAEILELSGFNYEESLERQKLKHEDVIKLREKAAQLPSVPKFISDKQVSVCVCMCEVGQGCVIIKLFFLCLP